MNIRISKLAQNEIDNAVSWCGSQSKGLGTRFLDDLDRTIRRIAAYPFSCVEMNLIFGGACLRGFPMELSTVLIPIQLLS
jgi:hypothetical protein